MRKGAIAKAYLDDRPCDLFSLAARSGVQPPNAPQT